MAIKLGYTIQYVQNVAKTVSFYEKAFGLVMKFITPEGDYAELNTGETTLAFASHTLGSSNISSEFVHSTANGKVLGVEFVFVTDDVDGAVRQALRYGATMESESTQKPWGQTVAYVRDPSGFLLEICTPIQS